MNIVLWILQVLLGISFIISGFGKVFFSWAELQQRIPWIDGMTHGMLTFIGWCELLGGIGVIIPAAIKVKPFLTPVSASGLAIIMLLATGFHILRGEYELMTVTITMGVIAAMVAYGRFILKPIH